MKRKQKNNDVNMELQQINKECALMERWLKVMYEVENLITNGAPEEHISELLIIATNTTQVLTRMIIKNPKLVEGYAEDNICWPFMITPFKNERAGYEFAQKIKLGKKIVKVTSTSSLKQLAAVVAVDLLKTATHKQEQASYLISHRYFYKKIPQKNRALFKRPASFYDEIKPIAELPPLTKETYKHWNAVILTPEFNTAVWPKIKDNPTWSRLKRSPAYAKEYQLKKYIRDLVMQSLTGLMAGK